MSKKKGPPDLIDIVAADDHEALARLLEKMGFVRKPHDKPHDEDCFRERK